MELLLFLFKVFGISLSGALAPGPVTAAAIGMGSRSRFAGMLIALGHGAIEFPLMVLLIFGVGKLLTLPWVGIGIGLFGGAFLIFIAWQMSRDLRRVESQPGPATRGGPFTAGMLLSGGNPYFLVWWATVGLTLITDVRNNFGVYAFVLFALVHWSCDLIWLTILSWASFKGSVFLGPKRRRILLMICALAMLGFGVYFIGEQVIELVKMLLVFIQRHLGAHDRWM